LGRNEITFRPFLYLKDMLREYSIDITDSDDFDFLFVGMHDFIDKKKSLNESIDYGLENISKITGDYFLFDGSDSVSMMGSYEVFEQSKAIYLFKNQILKSRKDYQIPYAFNKWFFGQGSKLDLSYDISEKNWKRIKLSNINCGRTIFGKGIKPSLNSMQAIELNKGIDLCAIFKAKHGYSEDHKVQNDLFYEHHRQGLWDKLQSLNNKYSMITQKLPFEEYVKQLKMSKISLSPFGMGEVCFRDFEAMLFGTILLKPDQSNILTSPNIYVEGNTYIGCKLDWSDLEEKIDYVMDNFSELNEKLNTNIRNLFVQEYSYENFCLYYYNLFRNLKNIIED
jgi:hypothetical protein